MATNLTQYHGPGWTAPAAQNLPRQARPAALSPQPARPFPQPENHPNFSDFSGFFAGFFQVFSAFSRKLFLFILELLSYYL